MNHKICILALGTLLIPTVLANLLVDLPNGRLRGRDDGDFYSYESIPYAEPPLGELRFELPQPYRREWGEHVFDATRPPVPCIQRVQFIDSPQPISGSEDCLTVNVYRPKNQKERSLPVIVDIHGGAFMFGSAAIDGHEPLMATGKFIVVKINYRLGPMGFLSTGDTTLPGNMGLKDQRLALQWIQENIARFGGQPENILLIGHSAGAASVHLQLLHKNFNQLAKVAVSVSGNALDPWVVQPGGRRRAFELGRIVGCGLLNSSEELKSCLKEKDAQEIMVALRDFLVLDFIPCTPFGPVVEPEDTEDAFLTAHPSEVIKSGQLTIPWLTSYLKDDGGFNAAVLMRKMANGEEQIGEVNRLWYDLAPLFFFYRHSNLTVDEMDTVSAKIRQYFLQNERFSVENYFTVQKMFTDIIFKNGAEESLYLHGNYGRIPVFGYTYDNPANRGYGQLISGREDLHFGTVHGDDFGLIFNNTINPHLRPDEKRLSRKFLKMLEEFLRTEQVTFESCRFENNVGKSQAEFTSITRDGCSV